MSPSVDFESTTSTNSITPAGTGIVYTIFFKKASGNFKSHPYNMHFPPAAPPSLPLMREVGPPSGEAGGRETKRDLSPSHGFRRASPSDEGAKRSRPRSPFTQIPIPIYTINIQNGRHNNETKTLFCPICIFYIKCFDNLHKIVKYYKTALEK